VVRVQTSASQSVAENRRLVMLLGIIICSSEERKKCIRSCVSDDVSVYSGGGWSNIVEIASVPWDDGEEVEGWGSVVCPTLVLFENISRYRWILPGSRAVNYSFRG